MPKVCTNLPNTESLWSRPKNEEVRSRQYLRSHSGSLGIKGESVKVVTTDVTQMTQMP